MNPFSFCLSGKFFISPSILNDNLASWHIFSWRFFPFSTFKTCHSLLSCKVSQKSLLIALWECPCTWLFLLVPLEFDLNFAILIMICLAVGLFGFILSGTLCASCSWISGSFFRFRKFSAIISSNTFSTPFSLLLWDPYNVNVSALDVVSDILLI